MLEQQQQQQQPTLAVQEVDPTTMEPSIHQLTMEPSIQHFPSVEPSVHNRSSSPAPDDSEDSSMDISRIPEDDLSDSDSDSVPDLVSTSESESDIQINRNRWFSSSGFLPLLFPSLFPCGTHFHNLRWATNEFEEFQIEFDGID